MVLLVYTHQVWHLGTGELLRDLKGQHKEPILCLALLDQQTASFLAASEDGQIKLVSMLFS